MTTSWLRWTLAAAMVAVALYHLARLARRRSTAIDSDAAHALMGLAMTAMLVGTWTRLDSAVAAAVFGLSLLWFLTRGAYSYVLHGIGVVFTPVQLVVGCAAMAYMLALSATAAAAVPGIAMPGMAMTADAPVVLEVALLLATASVAGWTLARRPSPTLAAGCQLAMNATTIIMLATM